MIAVIDSSPLISLAIIDKLDLLTSIFSEVYLPEEVYREISYFRKKQSRKLRKWCKDKVRKISKSRELSLFLDKGETEAILLSLQLKSDFLIIDDKRGRRIVSGLNINCIGTVGILLKAKQKSLISQIKPLITALQKDHIYITDELIHKVLVESGEIKQ